MSEEITYGSMSDIKPGRFILIDGIACRVVSVDTSKPGKHGAAKMRITAIGIFDGTKRTLLSPSTGDAQIPVIGKTKAQVVSISDNTVQLMNLETYETYEVPMQEELRKELKPGAEVEVMEYGSNRTMTRILGGV
ncbi:MAG: translation initiation factor IF-5A [Candidatus Marsarchaeota archaeon]|jgi:translation initiation factor 5A|nr:translation initiation factor IF-5A [Candidatus Marsarchaeota archaeon]